MLGIRSIVVVTQSGEEAAVGSGKKKEGILKTGSGTEELKYLNTERCLLWGAALSSEHKNAGSRKSKKEARRKKKG